jgi:hypothetical protein
MESFSMFVSYSIKSTGDQRNSRPILLNAKSEREASDAAIAVADFAYSEFASDVLIRIVGSDRSGRPIAEIRRPLSN